MFTCARLCQIERWLVKPELDELLLLIVIKIQSGMNLWHFKAWPNGFDVLIQRPPPLFILTSCTRSATVLDDVEWSLIFIKHHLQRYPTVLLFKVWSIILNAFGHGIQRCWTHACPLMWAGAIGNHGDYLVENGELGTFCILSDEKKRVMSLLIECERAKEPAKWEDQGQKNKTERKKHKMLHYIKHYQQLFINL